MPSAHASMVSLFQSTPSVWRETKWTAPAFINASDFNPLPPCGGRRRSATLGFFRFSDFNPLPPCGGRHQLSTSYQPQFNISIHSLRVEGDLAKPGGYRCQACISIHSLRVEGDGRAKARARGSGISIHSLRVEGDSRSGNS